MSGLRRRASAGTVLSMNYTCLTNPKAADLNGRDVRCAWTGVPPGCVTRRARHGAVERVIEVDPRRRSSPRPFQRVAMATQFWFVTSPSASSILSLDGGVAASDEPERRFGRGSDRNGLHQPSPLAAHAPRRVDQLRLAPRHRASETRQDHVRQASSPPLFNSPRDAS